VEVGIQRDDDALLSSGKMENGCVGCHCISDVADMQRVVAGRA
jgi:hypothetical protein